MRPVTARPLRRGLAGLAIAGGYVTIALATLGPATPLRPLFDGTHTQAPYRYVTPPTPDPAALPALGEEVTLEFDEREQDGQRQLVFPGGLVTTGDGQVSLSIPSGVLPVVEGQTGVRFTITPLDPVTLGEAPAGTAYDGNAAEITAAYVPSGDPVTFTEQDCTLGGCLTVIMRYAHAGTQLWIREGDAWREVSDLTPFASTFTMAAPMLEVGTFVVTRPPTPGGLNLPMLLSFVGGGLAVVAAVGYRWWRVRANRARSRNRASSAKTAGRKPSAAKKGRGATGGRPRR